MSSPFPSSSVFLDGEAWKMKRFLLSSSLCEAGQTDPFTFPFLLSAIRPHSSATVLSRTQQITEQGNHITKTAYIRTESIPIWKVQVPGNHTTMQAGSNESKQPKGVPPAGNQTYHSSEKQSFKRAEKAQGNCSSIVLFQYLRTICCSPWLYFNLYSEYQVLASPLTAMLCQNNTARTVLPKAFSPHSTYLFH